MQQTITREDKQIARELLNGVEEVVASAVAFNRTYSGKAPFPRDILAEALTKMSTDLSKRLGSDASFRVYVSKVRPELRRNGPRAVHQNQKAA